MIASDSLNIISMNCRHGDQRLSQDGRRGYLTSVLNDAQPDLCLLPGDTDDIQKNVVIGYDQFATATDKQTVLLYNYDRLRLKMPEASLTSLRNFPGVDFTQLVCPVVEVLSPQPLSSVVSEFSIVTWNYRMCYTEQMDRRTQAESIIRLSQWLADSRRTPVLIGGDFNLDIESVSKIVKKLSKDVQAELMMQVKGDVSSLPSMSMSPLLQLLKMDGCNRRGVQSQAGYHPSDYFVASKELDLKEATFIDYPTATGRQVTLDPRPTTATTGGQLHRVGGTEMEPRTATTSKKHVLVSAALATLTAMAVATTAAAEATTTTLLQLIIKKGKLS